MKSIYITTLALFALVSCTGSEEATNEAHNHEALELEMGLPTQDTIYSVIQCTGEVDVPPQSRATVSAPLGGYLREVKFYPGQYVNKGEILARVSHPDYVDLQRTYLDAKARVVFLESDLERKKELYKTNAINQRSLDEVQSNYDVQKATMMAAAASLRQIGINPASLTPETIESELILRSPITGYITNINANLGQHVTPEQELYEVVDDSHMHIELSVFPRDIQQVKIGQRITFTLPGDPTIHEGEIKQIGRQVQAESGAFIIHAHSSEELDGLRPGQYVDGQIILNPHKGYTLPKGAVLAKGDTHVVFVKEGEHYHAVEVEIGSEMGSRIEILTPLQEPVVLQDAHLLESFEGGHSH